MDEHLYENVILGTYGMNVMDFSEEQAENIRECVDRLRRNFCHSVCPNRYGEERARDAYMVTYYPYYVEPMRRVMEDWVIPGLRRHYRQLKLAFFSAGPCPELRGVLEALQGKNLYDHLYVHVHDLERGWMEKQRWAWDLCEIDGLRSEMDNLFQVGECDNMRPCDTCRALQLCQRDMYRDTDVYFMQNYLSHVENVDAYLVQLRDRFDRMKRGAMFAIVDLNYANVRAVLQSICSELPPDMEVRGTNIWNAFPESCPYPFSLPDGLEQRIFVGNLNGQRLIPKRSTRYYYAVLQKRGY